MFTNGVSVNSKIAVGIELSPSGQASVSAESSERLFDLAIELEEKTGLPVDVQHVLAAVIFSSKAGEIDPETTLSSKDEELLDLLAPHIRTVFSEYGGKVGRDD